MTTFDFKDGKGPVPAHQHSNGGGWVADTATVADTAYVGPDAQVYDVEGEIHNLTLYTGDCSVISLRFKFNARVYDNSEEDIFIEMDGKRYKLVEIV